MRCLHGSERGNHEAFCDDRLKAPEESNAAGAYAPTGDTERLMLSPLLNDYLIAEKLSQHRSSRRWRLSSLIFPDGEGAYFLDAGVQSTSGVGLGGTSRPASVTLKSSLTINHLPSRLATWISQSEAARNVKSSLRWCQD
jgi:hypothetical protein